MTHKVQILSVDLMDKYQGTVHFEINGNDYKAFFYEEEFEPKQNVDVELDHLESQLEWNVVFTENKDKEQRIEKSKNSEWSYYAYGKIKSINPVIADFGDLQLDLGNWTNDPMVIGDYIYWKIDRLDISKKKD